MRHTPILLIAVLLAVLLSACATVSPYGEATKPSPEAQAYAEVLLEKPPETLTEEERAFLLVYAQQAEARNEQARAQLEQGVFAISTGLTIMSATVVLLDRLLR